MPFERQSPLELHLEMFLLHQEASRHTQRTIDFYRYNLNRFLVFLIESKINDTSEVTAHHARQFIVDLERRNLSGAYMHSFARAIKTWFNFLVSEGEIERNPMHKVRMPKVEQKVLDPYTEAEVRALLKACVGEFALRDRCIVLGLLDTGLRASEFVAMDIGDVGDDGTVLVEGKGRKERWVRLSARTRKDLLRYLAGRGHAEANDPLWLGRKGRLSATGLLQLIRRLGQRAAVDPANVHRFRRTFAISSLRNGMDVHSLKEILGHADLATATHYLKFVKEDVVEVHKRTSPVDHWRL